MVTTANVRYTMSRAAARAALTQVLAAGPDLVGLQEWYLTRCSLLREVGAVRLAPGFTLGRSNPEYHWVSAVAGGNVVGARADRFAPVSARAVFLSGIGRSDRPGRFLGLEPPREVTVGVFRDLDRDRTVAMLSYHLVPGVQADGGYRVDDRPLLVRRHRHEVTRLEALIARLQQDGHVVYAAGDGNFDGLRLAGLTSSWEGRQDHAGTIGSATRKVDDVFGPGPASAVALLRTPSDHRALVTTRLD